MMKRRNVLICAGLAVLIPLLVVALRPDIEEIVEATRADLKRQGFKTSLAEFNFKLSAERHARATAITNGAGSDNIAQVQRLRRFHEAQQFYPDLMAMIGRDAAEVVSQQQIVDSQSGADLWQKLRDGLGDVREELDAAGQAALDGPIAFELDASRGAGMLLPHLGKLRTLGRALAARAMLELYDDHRTAAWNDLLAATRLATAWEPEPGEISHLVRFELAKEAYELTWQTLQNGPWSDVRLSNLAAEWESVDFFKGIPETVAFRRASALLTCEEFLQQPPSNGGMSIADMIRSPRDGFSAIQMQARELRYRQHGIYEDERNALLFFRDLEVGLRNAIQAQTWREMRELPVNTNSNVFRSSHYSPPFAILSLHETVMNSMRRGVSFLSRAAEAETRRRLLLTAIALERQHARTGAYPDDLAALNMKAVRGASNPVIDFMDGRPLRYRRLKEGHFILYSTGLDCKDDGGNGATQNRYGARPLNFGPQEGKDILWPRSAAQEEITAKEKLERDEENPPSTANPHHPGLRSRF